MSFEGFDQVLCKNGHLREFDCYNSVELFSDAETCSCGEVYVWRHIIDQTNGISEDDDELWTRRYQLEVIEPAVTQVCELGRTHVTTEARYRIPGVE